VHFELDNGRWAGTNFRTGVAYTINDGLRAAIRIAEALRATFVSSDRVIHKRKFATVAQIQQKRL
jgi:hypothetical protein